MRFLFIVQGEGRGHMTQAIALASLLRDNGHELIKVIVGSSKRREIPQYFKDAIGVPVSLVSSPNFITDNKSKSVKVGRSIVDAFGKLGTYRKSVKAIDEIVTAADPDVIINFYDFIGGIFNKLKSPRAKFYCVAHQYLAGHSQFEYPEGSVFDRISMKAGNWLTSFGANKKLALSFREMSDENDLTVMPPLLRKEVKEVKVSSSEHILVYMLNYGYSVDVENFHNRNPEVILHCFWDKKDALREERVDENLSFHQLDDKLFLEMMASSRGYLTTAGFESVCEAMYLGKPILMMPVDGHFEQACNALDAEKAGAGLASKNFDLQKLIEYIPDHKSDNSDFKKWVNKAEEKFLKILTS